MPQDTPRVILRLPPYHCEFNPIKLIWAEVKGEDARKNTTFKPVDATNFFNAAVTNVTPNNWA